jgi:hypothetical protein
MADEPAIPIELPKELIWEIDLIRRITGVEPELTELAPRRWRIAVRNERVYMDIDYRSASRGRIVWLRSGLFVDGKRRPRAKDPEHFGRIFHDPDSELPPEGAAIEPPPPSVAPETAPIVVQVPYRKLAAVAGAENVQIGRKGRRWVISISRPGRDFRMNFVQQGRKTYPAQRLIQLVVDGRDYSKQIRNQLEDAMALLVAPTVGPDAPGTTGSTEQGAGFGSVDVRRHSVMRN